MSSRIDWYPVVGQWYISKDGDERYKIMHHLGNVWWIYSYYSGSNVYAGTLNEVRHWITKHCYNHIDYARRRY